MEMEAATVYLDEALNLSKLELDLLFAGDVERAEALARDRGRLMDLAWRERRSIPQEQFLKKMRQLHALHEGAHLEAKRLHKLLQDDLLRIRKQGQLRSGYCPQVSSAMQEARFVSKQG
jgi:hypothetical protein